MQGFETADQVGLRRRFDRAIGQANQAAAFNFYNTVAGISYPRVDSQDELRHIEALRKISIVIAYIFIIFQVFEKLIKL